MLPPPAACAQPQDGGVHKSRWGLALRQAVGSLLLRIRPLQTVKIRRSCYDPVVLGECPNCRDLYPELIVAYDHFDQEALDVWLIVGPWAENGLR
jgi:hypothetical protein